MKIKIMNGDTACCASDCEFKNNDFCNLFYINLYGDIINPTRTPSCLDLTNTDAEFSTIRYEIDKSSKCFGCINYRVGFFNNCTVGGLEADICKDGNLNWYKA